MSKKKCPLDTKYGETVCRNGVLWELTYSEMGPPDQRQVVGDCPHCQPHLYGRVTKAAKRK